MSEATSSLQVEMEQMRREYEKKLQSQAKADVQEEARRAAELLQTLEDTVGGQEAAAEEASLAMERQQAEREHLLRFRGVRCKCVVQLLLIDSVEEVFFKHGHLLRSNQIVALLDSLTRCHEFARDFNANIELRNELWSQVRFSIVMCPHACACNARAHARACPARYLR